MKSRQLAYQALRQGQLQANYRLFPAGVFLFDLTEWSAVELDMTKMEPASVGLLDESISRP
jgi:hypothetical protein